MNGLVGWRTKGPVSPTWPRSAHGMAWHSMASRVCRHGCSFAHPPNLHSDLDRDHMQSMRMIRKQSLWNGKASCVQGYLLEPACIPFYFASRRMPVSGDDAVWDLVVPTNGSATDPDHSVEYYIARCLRCYVHFHHSRLSFLSFLMLSPPSPSRSDSVTSPNRSKRMPIRERIKKTFSARRATLPSSILPGASKSGGRISSKSSKTKSPPDALYYLPGEKLPLKYKRPVDKDHREKLASFSWKQEMKRNSIVSQYSPMGSRMPSRHGSLENPQSWVFGGGVVDRPWMSDTDGVRGDSDHSTENLDSGAVSTKSEAIETHQPLATDDDVIVALSHAETYS